MTPTTSEQDRELLELAAKAAGISGPTIARHDFIYISTSDAPLGMWAPLTDDGDALRLAVKLHLDVMTCCYRDEIQVGGKVRATTFHPIDGKDRYEAVRRAIVRAAAAIAKGAKE